jgi:hypothetical protein
MPSYTANAQPSNLICSQPRQTPGDRDGLHQFKGIHRELKATKIGPLQCFRCVEKLEPKLVLNRARVWTNQTVDGRRRPECTQRVKTPRQRPHRLVFANVKRMILKIEKERASSMQEESFCAWHEWLSNIAIELLRIVIRAPVAYLHLINSPDKIGGNVIIPMLRTGHCRMSLSHPSADLKQHV